MPVWTAPEQDTEQGRSLVADALTAYLEQAQKPHHPEVLEWMTAAMRKTVQRQLMKPRGNRKGYESATSYTGACAR